MIDWLPGLYTPGEMPKCPGICIYGRGGAGKTTLLGTMPGRGLVIDVPQIEGGTFVLKQHADRIKAVPVTEWDAIDKIHVGLREKKHDFQWVAIDSLTAFSQLALRKTIRERPLSQDPTLITKQDWGRVGQLMGDLIYRFRSLPLQAVLMTAQERRRQDDASGTMIGPDVSPAAFSALIPSMMITGYLYLEQGDDGWEHRLRVGPHPRYYTKCKVLPEVSDQVPSILISPNLDQLIRFAYGRGPAPAGIEDSPNSDILISE